ncbi:MAG: hypothetical protein WC916_01525 [Candidatus Woesearchaeota archaeon]
MKKQILYLPEIIADIKSKKELHALDDDFIEKKVEQFFHNISNHQYKEKILQKLSTVKTYKQFMKSNERDFLIKGVRTELRKVYGAFILEEYEKKQKILARMQNENDESIHEELLHLHKSTHERFTHYMQLYSTIFGAIATFRDAEKLPLQKQFIILDLACGLNPISNIYFRDKIKKYYASDISSEDCEFLETYFKKTSVPHETFALDLVDKKSHERLSKIPVDICFIFKTLDGLERVERNITEHLLISIHTKFFAITFPTLSIGGLRKIDVKRRVWLERLFDKLRWPYEKHEIENELLYVVKKTTE